MKTIALTGLLLLAACDRSTPAVESVQNNAQAYEAALRNEADNLSAQAAGAADANAADALRTAAEELDAERGNVAEAADARVDNLQ